MKSNCWSADQWINGLRTFQRTMKVELSSANYSWCINWEAAPLSRIHRRMMTRPILPRIPYHTCRESDCTVQQWPQSTQSAGPVRFLIFGSISIFLLASLVAGRRAGVILVQISRECTPPSLFTGISNLLQPAQAEVVLGQLSTYLASWAVTTGVHCVQRSATLLVL